MVGWPGLGPSGSGTSMAVVNGHMYSDQGAAATTELQAVASRDQKLIFKDKPKVQNFK